MEEKKRLEAAERGEDPDAAVEQDAEGKEKESAAGDGESGPGGASGENDWKEEWCTNDNDLLEFILYDFKS